MTGCRSSRIVCPPFAQPAQYEVMAQGEVMCGVTITTSGFIGRVRAGERNVQRPEDVLMDVHETMHAFTRAALGVVPSWINEGFSIATEAWLGCSPRTFGELRMEQASRDWHHVQRNERLEYGNQLGTHEQGAIFFAALREEANCDLACVRDIWNALRAARTNAERLTTATVAIHASRVTAHDAHRITRMIQALDQIAYANAAYP